MDAVEQSSSQTNRSSDKTRVPLLRAYQVVWRSCADIELMSREIDVLADVRKIQFDRELNASVDHIIWLPRVQCFWFGGGHFG